MRENEIEIGENQLLNGVFLTNDDQIERHIDCIGDSDALELVAESNKTDKTAPVEPGSIRALKDGDSTARNRRFERELERETCLP